MSPYTVASFFTGQDVNTEGKCLICVECGKNFACQLEEHELTHTGEISHRCPDCVNSYSHLSTLASPNQTFAESDDSNHLDAVNVERPCSSAASEDLHKQEQTETTRDDSESRPTEPVDDITSDDVTFDNKAQSQEELMERSPSPCVVSQDYTLSDEKGESKNIPCIPM